MPTTYRDAEHLQPMLASVIAEYHPLLAKHKVTFNLLTAHSVTDDCPLKHGGYECAGLVKINNLKDRVAGLADATMILDGNRWENWSEKKQRSLMDHEAAHILVVMKKGCLVTDDCGRPKLKMRKHDYQIGVFGDVIERHGEESMDIEACKPLHAFLSQRTFPWG